MSAMSGPHARSDSRRRGWITRMRAIPSQLPWLGGITIASLLTFALMARSIEGVESPGHPREKRGSDASGSGGPPQRDPAATAAPPRDRTTDGILDALSGRFDRRAETGHYAVLASTGLVPLVALARVAEGARARTLACILGGGAPASRSDLGPVPIVVCTDGMDLDAVTSTLARYDERLPDSVSGLAGFYHRRTRTIVIMPDMQAVASLVAHEAVHSAIHEILPHCASTLDEGLAQLIPENLDELGEERARQRSGRDFWRAVHLGGVLDEGGLPMPADFVILRRPASPGAESMRFRALAWCLITAMCELDRARGRSELTGFFGLLREGRDVVCAIDAAYGRDALSGRWSDVVRKAAGDPAPALTRMRAEALERSGRAADRE